MAYKGTDKDYAKIVVTDKELQDLPKENLTVGRWQQNYYIPVDVIEYNKETNKYLIPAMGWCTSDISIRYLKINCYKILPKGITEITYAKFMEL